MSPKIPSKLSSSSRENMQSRLIRLRQILGFSVREMAQEFGVAHGAIGLWEKGERPIPGPVLKLIELYEEELGMDEEKPKSKKVLKKIKTSWLTRGFKLSSGVASAFVGMASDSIQNLFRGSHSNSIQKTTYEAISHQMVESLGELKGFALKIGQMMSYMNYALPDSTRTLFETLQDNTPPMAHSAVVDCFLRELGKTPNQIFAEWSPIPFAAASIGQVHRAKLKSGEEVAVKVQYPKIEKTFKADLKGIKVLDSLLAILFRGMEKGDLYEELRDRFAEECDYLNEAKNQELFRKFFSKEKQVYIPEVYPEFSTARILTTEFVQAQSFKEFLKSATQEQRSQAGRTIFKFAMESIFKHHVFNGDPHPGNYLFQDDRVIFLDFGCVKHYSREFVKSWRECVRGVMQEDEKAMDEAFLKMGMVVESKKFDFDYNRQMLRTLHQPWLAPQPFQLTHEYVQKTWRSCVAENPNKSRMRMSKDWVFTNRLQWGLYSILATLEARVEFRKIMEELMK